MERDTRTKFEMAVLGELKRCPFCGGSDIEERNLLAYCPIKEMLRCMTCGATGPETKSRQAQEAWNTRATEQEMETTICKMMDQVINAEIREDEAFKAGFVYADAMEAHEISEMNDEEALEHWRQSKSPNATELQNENINKREVKKE